MFMNQDDDDMWTSNNTPAASQMGGTTVSRKKKPHPPRGPRPPGENKSATENTAPNSMAITSRAGPSGEVSIDSSYGAAPAASTSSYSSSGGYGSGGLGVLAGGDRPSTGFGRHGSAAPSQSRMPAGSGDILADATDILGDRPATTGGSDLGGAGVLPNTESRQAMMMRQRAMMLKQQQGRMSGGMVMRSTARPTMSPTRNPQVRMDSRPWWID
eukprot:g90.t1